MAWGAFESPTHCCIQLHARKTRRVVRSHPLNDKRSRFGRLHRAFRARTIMLPKDVASGCENTALNASITTPLISIFCPESAIQWHKTMQSRHCNVHSVHHLTSTCHHMVDSSLHGRVRLRRLVCVGRLDPNGGVPASKTSGIILDWDARWELSIIFSVSCALGGWKSYSQGIASLVRW